ncbi:MAG: hypothetical protein M1840_007920 [Geoglossum simile]|nr:MAG: hypothetical protein M1840_007920 [Geoglossum simile]
MATSSLRIPRVTEDDLVAFHAHHFSGRQQSFPSALLSGPAYRPVPPREDNHEDGDLEYDHDDGDGLGYYPDGVKRTLTDAQIEMFRWSEVQSLLKAKRRQLDTLDEGMGSTEGNWEQQAIKHLPGDGSEEAGARRSLGSKKRGRMELGGLFGESPTKRAVHDTNSAGERCTLNYDDISHTQDRVSAKATSLEDGEDEEEYEKFLVREREELSYVSAQADAMDPDIKGGAEGGLSTDSISVAGLEIAEQYTSNSATTMIPLDTVLPPSNSATQPVHSRRRVFYGDDDSSAVSDNYKPPESTPAVAAGGIAKGEKRAFLWPKIGGG